MPAAEAEAFEQAVRASGRDPAAFRVQVFEASPACGAMRRVHVVTCRAAAQYEASTGTAWTRNFARHLERGFFG
jgi:hypothetical protein